MKYIFALFFVSTLSCAGGVEESKPDYMQVHKPYLSMTCINEVNQQAMDKCGELSLVKATNQMNDILKKLSKSYTKNEPDLSKALTDSQLSWHEYTKNGCQLETYYSRNGSGYGSILNACLESKINERISFLNWLMENP